MVTKYQKRISGPLLDRIDIHIEVPRVDYEKLSGNKTSETSEAIRQFCQLQDEGQSLMRAAMSQLQLSARAYHRILKLARTIADLAESEDIQSAHLAEALQYRPKIMMGWSNLIQTSNKAIQHSFQRSLFARHRR